MAFPIEDFNEEAKIMESMDSFIQDNEFSLTFAARGSMFSHRKRRRPFSAPKSISSPSAGEETERKRKAELGSSVGKTENRGKKLGKRRVR